MALIRITILKISAHFINYRFNPSIIPFQIKPIVCPKTEVRLKRIPFPKI